MTRIIPEIGTMGMKDIKEHREGATITRAWIAADDFGNSSASPLFSRGGFELRHLMEACGLDPDDTAARSQFRRDEEKFRPTGHTRQMTAYHCFFIALQYELFKLGVPGENVAALSTLTAPLYAPIDDSDGLPFLTELKKDKVFSILWDRTVWKHFLVFGLDENHATGERFRKWCMVDASDNAPHALEHVHILRLWPLLHTVCSRVDWLPAVPQPPTEYPAMQISERHPDSDAIVASLTPQEAALIKALRLIPGEPALQVVKRGNAPGKLSGEITAGEARIDKFLSDIRENTPEAEITIKKRWLDVTGGGPKTHRLDFALTLKSC